MNSRAQAVVCVAAGLIVGFIAGQQYTAYRIQSAFRDAFAPHAEQPGLISPSASFSGADAQRKVSPDLEKVAIIGARVQEKEFMGPELVVSVKNGSAVTFERLTFDCDVKTPGRPVPWATCSDVLALIPGGLAPGETRDVSARGLGGMYGINQALKEHLDAQLTVAIVDGKSVK